MIDTEKTWIDFIPVFLKDFYSQFTCYGNDMIHALIVEGNTDEEFYWALFDKSYFILDNKKIVFNTPKKKILSNFSNNFENLVSKNPYELKQHKKEFLNADKSDYKSYRFVTECIKYYEENKSNFKKLDCYGLIDNDFGHNELIGNLVNIAATKYHDRETCIMRCYLPDYFELIEDKKRAVELLAKIINVGFKQGILERESFKYVEKKPEELNQTIIKFTHSYFKYNADKEKLIDFDFDKYFENYDIFYSDLINNYKKEVEVVYTFEDELVNILSRWLIERNITKVDEGRLDRIFKYCNGHILLNQMILCGKGIYMFNTEKEFTDSVISNIAFGKQKYILLFETLPLKPYKNYRIEHKYYTKL